MKVSQEKTGDLTSLIKIEIQQADYQPEVDKQLKDQRKKLQLPGFRVGQVPLSMVKKMYENTLVAQEVEKLINENLYKYIQDNNMKVLCSPMANNEKNPQNPTGPIKDFTLFFDVALQPEFDLDLSKINTTFYQVEPTKENVDSYIENLCKRFGKQEQAEAIDEKDLVYGRLVELDDQEKEKKGGLNVYTSIAIDKIPLATVKKQFIGKKKDAEIKIKPAKLFKDDNLLASFLHISKDEAKGFDSQCNFKVDSIERVTPAEINSELFKKVYPAKDIQNEQQFTEAIKEELSNNYANTVNIHFMNTVSDTLQHEVKFSLPEEFLKKWLIENNHDKKKEDLEAEFPKFLDAMRWQLIESKICEQYNITVNKQEVVDYFQNELLPMYFPVFEGETEEQKQQREHHLTEIANNMAADKEQSRKGYDYVLDRKLIKVLRENTVCKLEKVALDDYLKIVSQNNQKNSNKEKTEKSE